MNLVRRFTPLGIAVFGLALAAFVALLVGTVFVSLGRSLR